MNIPALAACRKSRYFSRALFHKNACTGQNCSNVSKISRNNSRLCQDIKGIPYQLEVGISKLQGSVLTVILNHNFHEPYLISDTSSLPKIYEC